MTRKLTLDDLWNFKSLGNIALSPDGRRIAFELHSMDKAKNENQTALWLLHLDEQGYAVGEPRQLTGGDKNDTNPVWASDSRRLLFVSNRDGKNQLWLIDTNGGEAHKLTSMLRGVGEAAWSPDGQWVAFTANGMLDDEDELLTGVKTLSEAEQKKREEEERLRLRTITTIRYRLDGRGLIEQFSHLFVMPAPAPGEYSVDAAAIRRLTSGDFDHAQPLWTPDSAEIGVLSNREERRHTSHSLQDLWAIDRETGAARRLSDATLEISSYAWSPDGRQAVIVGAKDQFTFVRSHPRLHLLSRDGGPVETLTADIDSETAPMAGGGLGFPGPYRPQWSKDGKHIYFLLTNRGSVNTYRLDIEQKAVTSLTSEESVTYWLALLPDGRDLLLVKEQPLQANEFYLLPLNITGTGAGQPEQLTHLYEKQMAEFVWSEPQRMSYAGANGEEIDGWYIPPLGARAGVRYPLMAHIHGGPHWAFGAGIDPLYQFFAAQGWGIFYCNPHGSTGCGEQFMRSVLGDWGGKDFQDIMLGVDECIARGVADPERLAVTGYSYGGYMTMFTIGHTDRFKAAVPMAGISNLVSFVGVSDIGIWQVAEAQGYPWDPERESYYRERSPITSAANVTTPTLFLHPENDLRCPIEQSEQFYMRLKMMGHVPVEFVRSPASWHGGTSKPNQWLAYWQTMLDWFYKYIEMRAEEYD